MVNKRGAIAQNDFFKTNGGPRRSVDVGEYSMARQEFAAECDINTIMERYQTTGQLPMNRPGPPVYYDFTNVPPDLLSTLAMMDNAAEAFMTLPAKVRREFDNDAHLFVEFAADPQNVGQMREWGLARPVPSPEPARKPEGEAQASSPPPPATHDPT